MTPARIRYLAIRLSAMRCLPSCIDESGFIDTASAMRLMRVSRVSVIKHAKALGFKTYERGEAPASKVNGAFRELPVDVAMSAKILAMESADE